MPFDDLRQWIAALERAGELKRIQTEVDPILEIAEITDRVSKSKNGKPGGPALLFQNIKGHPGSQVLINQFGSEARMKLALGVNSFDEFADRIRVFMDLKSPQGFLDKLKMLPAAHRSRKVFPQDRRHRPLQGSHQARQLLTPRFPHPAMLAAGRRPLYHPPLRRHPRPQIRQAQRRNVSPPGLRRHHHRRPLAASKGRRRTRSPAHACRSRTRGWPIQAILGLSGDLDFASSATKSAAVDLMARTSGGQVIAKENHPAGKMEVAVAIGTDPAVTFSAIVPAPPDVEEYLIAGFLRSAPVELVKCETVDLEVPASSEIVLEGYVNLDELRTEGPFGDHTGFYSLADLYPVFHVQCITHRKDPIYSTTIVGKPPMEDAYMGKAVERVFLPLMRLTIPELIDINLPIEGVFHNLMIVSIRKSYPGQARKVMNAIWSLGQAMFTKCIIVVDEDVDVQNIR